MLTRKWKNPFFSISVSFKVRHNFKIFNSKFGESRGRWNTLIYIYIHMHLYLYQYDWTYVLYIMCIIKKFINGKIWHELNLTRRKKNINLTPSKYFTKVMNRFQQTLSPRKGYTINFSSEEIHEGKMKSTISKFQTKKYFFVRKILWKTLSPAKKANQKWDLICKHRSPQAVPTRLTFSCLLKSLLTSYGLEISARDRIFHCRIPFLSYIIGRNLKS